MYVSVYMYVCVYSNLEIAIHIDQAKWHGGFFCLPNDVTELIQSNFC